MEQMLKMQTFEEDSDAEIMLKIIVIGNINVGKTSIINNICYNQSLASINTIGVGFHEKRLNVCGKEVKICFWDFSGQDRFLCLTRCYFNDANAAIVVMDSSKVECTKTALNWKKLVDETFVDEPIPTFLLANKYDLIKDDPDREMLENKFDKFAQESNFDKCCFTSAKDGTGVQEAIESLVHLTIQNSSKRVKKQQRDSFRLSNTPPPNIKLPTEKKRCCS